MSNIPQDQAARDSIRHDLHTTFLVEAGAGSGKTTGLIQRMVQLVLSGTCRVENLAAITFTRKAAAELRSRFQIGLEHELAACTDPQLRQRAAHAVQCGLARRGVHDQLAQQRIVVQSDFHALPDPAIPAHAGPARHLEQRDAARGRQEAIRRILARDPALDGVPLRLQ